MKEVTYEDWQKNPTPRVMWCWNSSERDKVQAKVISVVKTDACIYPVLSIMKGDVGYETFRHCAEIEKQRRMTNKELSRWLREKPTRECKWTFDGCVCSVHTYNEKCENEEVHKDVVIREDDGEWREPLVEEQITFEKEKEEIKRLTDFIEPREKRIAELEKENAELKSELNALKTSDY